METRANHVWVGAVTLVILGALALFIIVAGAAGRGQNERTEYDIFFEQSVEGLSNGSQVTFNGVPAGEVKDIELWTRTPQKVRVRIAIKVKVPVPILVDRHHAQPFHRRLDDHARRRSRTGYRRAHRLSQDTAASTARADRESRRPPKACLRSAPSRAVSLRSSPTRRACWSGWRH